MRGTPHKHGIRKWSTRNVTSHTPKICHSTVLYTIDIIYACNSFVSWGGTSDKECLQQKKQLIFCLPETGGGGEQYWSCLQKSKYELFCWAFYEKKRKQKSSFSGFWRQRVGGGRQLCNCLQETKYELLFFCKHSLPPTYDSPATWLLIVIHKFQRKCRNFTSRWATENPDPLIIRWGRP